jgi:hypothetical protein
MMIVRSLKITLAAFFVATAVAGCTAGSPTAASVTAPKGTAPAANVSIRFADQPITLTVQNAVATGSTASTYTFEVATDTAFQSIVQTKDNISEGSNGQTSVVLSPLTGPRDYFWRARATGGGTTGPNSGVLKFSVGVAVVVNTPSPISPLNGTTTQPRPTLRVTNATRSGTTGAISYKFEIATSSTFANVIVNETVSEGTTETGFTPGPLPVATTLFWRATAIDVSSGVSSASSAVQSFTTRNFTQAEDLASRLGIPLWPGKEPPGTNGHATMGNNPDFGVGWDIQMLHYTPGNVDFQCPDIEMARLFDLFDKGYHPDDAVAWMKSNGYPTEALWYPPPEKAVMGLQYVYIAARGKVFVNGIWDVVLRVE